ncbi:dockerin type I domain-containing protein [Blastopirellula sp. J2-11]|uniref:ELWxxDGT repeat protein n=1 Tax=Blastopirellula sp. J2-11 TaxID=2943192 RepID=UPI0021C7B04C|nr:ELWxxDGT repeat protein [Blastopirellula sp. J2-11]UUO06839.1 dockerin type I domain-containing protein [Blastopirellula sp. J2-11]
MLTLAAEQLEVRAMLAADTLLQADRLEGEAAAPTITVDAATLVYATESTASNCGTFTGAVTLSASVGTINQNDDGTWFWTLGDVQVSDSQTVTITADDDMTTLTFELTVKSTDFQLLHDTEPGDGINTISQFVRVGDEVYFTSYPSQYPVTLWKTDGTGAGTTIIESTTASFENLIEFKGELYYFRIAGDNPSYDLWKSNGTEEGTVSVFDFSTSNPPISIVEIAVVGDLFYFNVDDGVHGQELWVSNGTAEGTHLVADINPGSTGTEIYDLTATDHYLFFSANDGVHGNELWRTDGTPEGTKRLTDLFPDDRSQRAYNPIASGDVVYFVGFDGFIRVADGDTGETSLLYRSTVDDDVPVQGRNLSNIDGQIYYQDANQLWTTDGTPSGTRAISGAFGDGGGNLVAIAKLNGELYVSVDSYDIGGSNKLWKVSESTSDTTLLASFQSGTVTQALAIANEGALYFRGYDPTLGFQTWRTDGTPEGTTRINSFLALESGTPLPIEGPDGTLIMGIETAQFDREPYVVQLDTPPVITLQPIQLSEDGQSILLSALGTYDLLDSLSELQFDWDLDGDGRYDNASGLLSSISLTELATLGVANISLRVIDTDGQIATRSLVLDSAIPIISVDDSDGIIVNEGSTAENGGRFGHALGGDVELTASVGVVTDNKDGTWSWSYTTLDGPDDTQTVTINAVDGGHQSSISFALVVHNQAPSVTNLQPNVTVMQGMVAVTSGTYSDVAADTVFGTASIGDIVIHDDGTWSWSFDTSQIEPGSDRVHVRLYDEQNSGSEFSFSLIVDPVSPVIEVNNLSLQFVAGSTASNSGTFYSPNGQFAYLSASQGTVIDKGDGTWFWAWHDVPQQPVQTITITVQYGDGSSGFTTFDLAVSAKSDAYLIKDLLDHGSFPNSQPEDFIRLGDAVYFIANNNNNEVGLWRTDGTEEGTLFIHSTGRLSSSNVNYESILNVNGILYFVTFEQGVTTLWISDGTTEGTRSIAEFDSPINYLTVVNGEVFFAADDGLHGFELWKSNGTDVGTVMVADINPYGSSNLFQLAAVNGVLVFTAENGVHGKQIWKSDGSSAGTMPLTELESEISLDFPVNVDGILYFPTLGSSHGYELWKSDGTAEGTGLAFDIVPGEEPSHPNRLRSIDGTFYFQATTPEHGTQLWKLNPASGQVVRLTDFAATPDERIYPLVSFQGDVYFFREFYDASTKQFYRPTELWKISGATGAATVVAQVSSGGLPLRYNVPYELDGKLYFHGYDEVAGSELWMTDGTPEGTVQITDLAQSGLIRRFIHFEDKFIFAASEGYRGVEPYAFNLTSGPVAKIADPRGSDNRQNILLSAFGSYDFQDPVADLQFAWDLDGDGIYDDAVGINPSLSIAEWELPPSWWIGLLVTNSRGISATAAQVVDTQSPYVSVDQIQVQVNLNESVINSGEFGSLQGESVTLSASLGDVVDNGDGTWSWSYTAPTSGPSRHHTVVITADDGFEQSQITFDLFEQNPRPVIEIIDGSHFVLQGDTAIASGTYSDASAAVISMTASIGDLVDHGDGTWSWSYVVPLDAVGTVLVRFSASDADGATTTRFFSPHVTPISAAYITINNSPAATDESGEVQILPADLIQISEWDSFTVNVWVRRDESRTDQLTNVSMNLHYNNARFQLDSFTPSSGVGLLEVSDTSDMLEINANQFDLGDDLVGELLLIGSFRFRPGPESAIANDIEGNYPESFDLEFSLTDVQTKTDIFGEVPGQQVGAPTTQLQVVPYDVDDDGSVSLIDLTYLIRKIGTPVATDPKAYKFDFDRNGAVSLVDLTYLIRNIGKNAYNGGQIQFPKYYQPPVSPLETEALVAQTESVTPAASSSLLEAEEIPPSEPVSPPPNNEEANLDAAFGTLGSLIDCWESSTDDNEVQENFEQAISFAHTQWRPDYVPDWVLQESAVADCVVEHAVELIEELAEEFPRLDQFFDRLKSRFEDR